MQDPVVALPIRSFRDAFRRLAAALDPRPGPSSPGPWPPAPPVWSSGRARRR